MKSKTFGIIKPNATALNLQGGIFKVIEENDLKVVLKKEFVLTREQAGEFYKEHDGKFFFEELIDFMTSGPVIAFVVEGEDAMPRYRELMGKTDPAQADKGTLRFMFATKKSENSVHGSDSPESAEREINFFFA